MTENDLYNKVKRALLNYVPSKADIKLQRIESGGTGLGIPDVAYCINGVSGWIENKIISHVPVAIRGKVTIPFRPGQLAWVHDWTVAGGKVLVFCSYGNTLAIIRGADAKAEYNKLEFSLYSNQEIQLNRIDASILYSIMTDKKKSVND